MADKRTTPDAPEPAQQAAPQDAGSGPRGKKRAAPTIDLTATEMPPPQSKSPPGPELEPAPAQEPPSALAGGAPGETAVPPRGGQIGMALAGVAGGVLVTLAVVALWLSGLVPARYAASSDTSAQIAALETQVRDLKNRPAAMVDTASVDALTQRVGKIEDTMSKLPAGDVGVAERLAAADSAMKSLGSALTTLNRRSDDIAATASQASERADAAAKTVTELSASVQEIAKSNAAGIPPPSSTPCKSASPRSNNPSRPRASI